MKQILCATSCGVLVAMGLAGCDAAPPQQSGLSRPAEPQSIAAGETLTDVVREALADVVRDEDAYSRARRLGALLPTLGPETVSAAKDTLEDLRVDLGPTEIELLVRYWATYQPEEASRWAVDKSPPGYRVGAIHAALALWAEADPRAAAAATLQWMPRNDLSAAVTVALARGWFDADPADLERFIREMGAGWHQQRAIAVYTRRMAQKRGSAELKRWAESLPDDDESYKLAVFRRTVDALALFDIQTAVRWCDEHCSGPYGKNMRSLIARSWVLHDGPSALAWLSSAREGTERDLAVRVTFALWTRTDRAAALAWMAAQTTGGEAAPWLRSAYPVYARLLAEDAPADAIAWAERIEDDNTRENTLIQAARAWRQLDEAAAEKWLLESSLSEQAREKVRAPAPATTTPGSNG